MHQNLLLHEVFAVNADIRNTREELAEQGNYLLDRSAGDTSADANPKVYNMTYHQNWSTEPAKINTPENQVASVVGLNNPVFGAN